MSKIEIFLFELFSFAFYKFFSPIRFFTVTQQSDLGFDNHLDVILQFVPVSFIALRFKTKLINKKIISDETRNSSCAPFPCRQIIYTSQHN